MSRAIRHVAVLLSVTVATSIGITVPANATAFGAAFLDYEGNDESELLDNTPGCHQFVGENLLSTLGARSAVVFFNQSKNAQFWSNTNCTGYTQVVPKDNYTHEL